MRSDTANRFFTRKGLWKAMVTVCLAITLALGVPGLSSTVEAVRVGVYPNEPLIFKDKDGQFKGIYNDLLVHVAKEEKWDLKYVPGSWAECIERLNNHEIDLMTASAYSEARSRVYDFNQVAVIENWGQVYLPENSPIEMFLDLSGKKMAVLKDDIYYATFKILGDRFQIKPHYVEAESYAACPGRDALHQEQIGKRDGTN